MQLRSFLGGENVYRRFIQGYAKIASPLHDLLKGLTPGCGNGSKHPVEFGDAEMEAFQTLIKEPPVLALSVVNRKLSVDTDTSPYQIGCALF